ncbi:oligoribonuclease [Histophilus somni]|uniref:Oligoribonuclease n=1 Tax=Histophilus somni TaxID=731 RepID=A0A9Q7E470_HISSO|nr:oligoribonuclease [Histophilus somni]ARU65169.1 oligoribonuclease [Histophilus somni]ARU67034.1 oligoribonuclease [Histophilus somni]ARU68906.1 oligoribonuclease [Histophilus somni]ARU70787.1 oligoribonuclease [Histophilus somni]ARU72660.1 oligoribonuclease [Histophilus somni]
MQLDKQNLIWIDLEMTGLDPDKERIIEIATIVTDKDLNILAEGPVLAIHQSNELLNNMNEWCVKTHTSNGLIERVKNSKLTERAAELQTLDFLKKWVPKGVSPICGNSVAQDKRFLVNYMPELAEYFHYRHLDVSTLKELASRWKPEILNSFEKKNTHLALDDIRESIAELAHYRNTFINLTTK